MTPLWLQCAVPAALVALAGSLWRRYSLRTLPALYFSSAVEFVFRVVWILKGQHVIALPSWAGLVTAPVQLAALTAVTYEVLLYRRVYASVWEKARVAFAVIAASVAFGFAPDRLLPAERVYLGRMCCYLSLFLVNWGVVIWRRCQPVAEWRQHRAYSLSIAIWLTVRATASTFVRGGLGYRIFPRTDATWYAVDAIVYAAFTLAIVGMAVMMSAPSPRRKRAAKTGDGWLQSAGRKAA